MNAEDEKDPVLEQLDRLMERRCRMPIASEPIVRPTSIVGWEVKDWRDIPDILSRRLRSRWKHLTNNNRQRQIEEANRLADYLSQMAHEVRRVLGKDSPEGHAR